MLRVASRQLLTRRAAVIGGSLTAIGTAGTYAAYSDNTLGLRRQSQFWVRVFPIVFDYYWNFAQSSPYVRYQKWSNHAIEEEENKAARQKALQQMHDRHAPDILHVMLDLKGLYIKLGQVLSVTALPIPEPYRVVFRTLQSDVPGWEEFEQVVKPVLEKEFGSNLDEIFSSVDPVPCGAASIGQAHRATLRENGEEVIIKVQYPNASWQVPADIRCVGDFLKICVWCGIVDESASRLSYEEFSRQFLAELDYGAERRNLQEVYQSSIQPNSPYQKWGVVVPSVYEDFCTNKVITMTYLPGPKLEQEARRQLEMLGIDTKKGIGGVVRASANDTSSGPSSEDAVMRPLAQKSWQESAATVVGKLVGVDSIMWAVRFMRRIMAWSTAAAVVTVRTASPLLPQEWEEWADSHRLAVQQAERLSQTESWIDALFDVHGHQIFELGLFNADPHPGNILVLDEDDQSTSNRLGLIDFGQCKRLNPQEQVKVANLILTVANDESDDRVAKAFRDLGIQTKNDSTEFLACFAHLMFGPLKPEHLSHDWHKKLHNMDHVNYFPKELSMVYRTSLLLRGLAFSLQVNSSIGEQWRHHAQRAVDRNAGLQPQIRIAPQTPSTTEVALGSPLVT